ncbi:MAG: 2-amino-4-hydroxy-6-hydroxymethyldihydropteridine diphosphokinase [Parabacteroides sp.]|mgnify:CR=1|nr:2-amino-4-hydroxy-6-hydroxymethyldihydropteridine diphosphokinase [Parabacteroides sp.]MCI7783784.1 2-amino-4-hydroxy-6-hydroxymethyldihydropteridine diphosphokinase [Parabacteroides sp.]MDD7061579.1 2-amino-4-hydroxy-6-hydroxymethyldihydropteridine diphosphokinase [bacterium]MDY4756097.1 2-amino-4-hydroxy-6-hydroxymethyldihydropteridine diphosphokinase [Parabacteroides sp.]
MNCAYLCIGSNRNKEVNIKRAEEMLRARFASIRFSPLMETEAIGCPGAERYLNQMAVCYCEEPLDEVQVTLKRMEWEIGRRPTDKATGRMPIDIDLIQWNDQPLKPADLQRSYVKEGLRYL